jgi:hypothetical protein
MTDQFRRLIIDRVKPWIEQNPKKTESRGREAGESILSIPESIEVPSMRRGGMGEQVEQRQVDPDPTHPRGAGNILTDEGRARIDSAADAEDTRKSEFDEAMSRLSDAQLDRLLEETIPAYARNDRAIQSRDQRELDEYVRRRRQGAIVSGVRDWR